MEAFADRWLEAWTGNRPQELLAFYAPGATYTDPAKAQGIDTRIGLAEYFTKLLARYPDWKWTRDELHPLDGHEGFVLQHTATIPLVGETIVERCMDLVLLDENGLIKRNDVYFDRARWMALLKR